MKKLLLITLIIHAYTICIYSQDLDTFTGVLNKRIHEKALTLNLKQDWNNSITRHCACAILLAQYAISAF